MHNELQDLTAQEAATVTGGDGWLMHEVGYWTGYIGHAITDAFLTPSPDGDFNWATDK
jgi:hypothetical protein